MLLLQEIKILIVPNQEPKHLVPVLEHKSLKFQFGNRKVIESDSVLKKIPSLSFQASSIFNFIIPFDIHSTYSTFSILNIRYIHIITLFTGKASALLNRITQKKKKFTFSSQEKPSNGFIFHFTKDSHKKICVNWDDILKLK